MAKNREPLPKPAESEETDDELVTDSGSESGSDSEQETPPPPKSTITPPAVSNSSESLSGSDSESSDSESESESVPPAKNPAPKSKPNTTSSQDSAAGVKRPPGKTTEVQDSKKPKKTEPLLKKDGKSEGAASEDVSKKLFQRVFSEDDEIVLLKGMLDFIQKKKSDPVSDVDQFLDFIKKLKLLHCDVTKAQLVNKMKRLKVKYQNNASKVKDGNERKFSKEHEREGYALSKSIWGGIEGESNIVGGGIESAKGKGSAMKKCQNKNGGARVSNEVEDKVAAVGVKDESAEKKLKGVGVGTSGASQCFDGFYVYSALEKKLMTEEIMNVDSEKEKELEKKMKEIEVAELQLFAKRCEFMAEKARLIVAAKKM